MRLHLIRHASYALAGTGLGGRGEHPLDGRGRRQVEALAERLAGAGLAAVHTSPQRRAVETALPIAARHGLAPEVEPDLAELDFGHWTGRSFADLAGDPLWQRFNAARGLTRIPGGEMMLEAQARLAAAVQRLQERHPDAAVALVSHADPLRALLCHLLGLPLDRFAAFEIAPAGMAIVELDDWGARLLELRPAP